MKITTEINMEQKDVKSLIDLATILLEFKDFVKPIKTVPLIKMKTETGGD